MNTLIGGNQSGEPMVELFKGRMHFEGTTL